ncbi:hypothetical protein NM208_g3346 [Fusarium decemcellulare]|uniref:Uncharacterized protein n=1 Tax=Fusarium decemcellulare TaxID=57161 RepID=A0ACC1SPB2_9HYPO|nr:hypothetical protein NM208_g3346 [Fusarium decemcellulare]
MDNIPFVVLQTIFLHLKRDAKRSHNDLLACSLVDKSWHYAAMPFLYAIIALDMDQAERFTLCFNVEKYAKFVLSLTIRIESGYPAMFNGRQVHDLTLPAIVDDRLTWLVFIVEQMTSLVFFSLYTQPLSHLLPRREIILGFLCAIPKTCKGLELDVWNLEDPEDQVQPGRPHLCDTIHLALTRLEYVRLRMGHMCSAMFGVDDGYHHHFDKTRIDVLGPVWMLNLRAMIINCGFLDHDLIHRCNHWLEGRKVSRSSATAKHTAWRSLTKAMEQVVENGMPREQYRLQGQKQKKEKMSRWSFPPWLLHRNNVHPNNPQITITCPIPSDAADGGIWTTYIRADMVKKESWAIPQCDTDPHAPFSRAVRLPAGDERMVTEVSGETLIEGEAGNWCDMLNGARLPAEILDLPPPFRLANECCGPNVRRAIMAPVPNTSHLQATTPRGVVAPLAERRKHWDEAYAR